ncbi:MAG: FdtA/QdtA family cupin domain-containing protein [bacterium]|nr:FdtA/QdtA family cupin domain-containing protein [bacterium]
MSKERDEILLTSFPDASRGNLFVGEAARQIPFPIKRFYVLTDIPSRETVRGGHAHKRMEQVMFCVRGSCLMRMDDGENKWTVLLDTPSTGIRIRSNIWHDFTECSKDTVVLVVASEYYDEVDYIRDYEAFLRLVTKGA